MNRLLALAALSLFLHDEDAGVILLLDLRDRHGVTQTESCDGSTASNIGHIAGL
jgi:hypothetical protein